MLPVTWHDGWPVILPKGAAIPYVVPAPKFIVYSTTAQTSRADEHGHLANAGAGALYQPTGNFEWLDEFNSTVLDPQWLYVRTPVTRWADLTQRPGWLTIHALHVGLDSLQNMSFLARRQQHQTYDASTELDAAAYPGQVSAGLAAFQNQNYWYFLGVRQRTQGLEVFLEKRAGKETQTVATAHVTGAVERIRLRISANAGDYSFYFDPGGTGWMPLKEHQDGSILSTDVAGGFVGAMVGPYARAD